MSDQLFPDAMRSGANVPCKPRRPIELKYYMRWMNDGISISLHIDHWSQKSRPSAPLAHLSQHVLCALRTRKEDITVRFAIRRFFRPGAIDMAMLFLDHLRWYCSTRAAGLVQLYGGVATVSTPDGKDTMNIIKKQ
jgi:hypothetical protein